MFFFVYPRVTKPSCSVTIKTHIQINYGNLKFDQIWRIWRVRDRERERETSNWGIWPKSLNKL